LIRPGGWTTFFDPSILIARLGPLAEACRRMKSALASE